MYLNHTPLAPSSDIRWRGLELFIWLSDVTADLAHSSRSALCTTGLSSLPHVQPRSQRPSLYEQEVSGARPEGTMVVCSTDTLHRATELTSPSSPTDSASTLATATLRTPGPSRHSWGDQSFHPAWQPFVEQAIMRQLLLFGFLLPRVIPTRPQRPSRVSQLATPVSDLTPLQGHLASEE